METGFIVDIGDCCLSKRSRTSDCEGTRSVCSLLMHPFAAVINDILNVGVSVSEEEVMGGLGQNPGRAAVKPDRFWGDKSVPAGGPLSPVWLQQRGRQAALYSVQSV